MFHSLSETGTFAVIPCAGNNFAPIRDGEWHVTKLKYFDDSPSESIRRAGAEFRVSRTTIWRYRKAGDATA